MKLNHNKVFTRIPGVVRAADAVRATTIAPKGDSDDE